MEGKNKNLVREIAKQVLDELGEDKETYRLVHDYLLKQRGAKTPSSYEAPLTQKRV